MKIKELMLNALKREGIETVDASASDYDIISAFCSEFSYIHQEISYLKYCNVYEKVYMIMDDGVEKYIEISEYADDDTLLYNFADINEVYPHEVTQVVYLYEPSAD